MWYNRWDTDNHCLACSTGPWMGYFVSGVKKGADKVGITPIVQGAVEIVKNGTQNIVSNLRQ